MRAKNTHMPIKIMKFNKYKHKHCICITQGLLKSTKYRDSLDKQFKMSTSNSPNYEVVLTNFKTYNSMLKNIFEQQKKKHYFELCFNFPKHHFRKTWKIINEILSKNKANIIFYFKDNVINITDKTDIANKLNNYFTSIGQSIAQGIQYDGNNDYSYYFKKTS